jgi:hypothetical protein
MESVYCAVRTGYFYKTDYFPSLEVKILYCKYVTFLPRALKRITSATGNESSKRCILWMSVNIGLSCNNIGLHVQREALIAQCSKTAILLTRRNFH